MDATSDALEVLRRVWGYEAFRPLQAEAVQAALDGRDSLVVLPTGGGKSLCYQLPAAARRGTVLVVSPLIALMDDQVKAARDAGLSAVALHSNRDDAGRRADWQRLRDGCDLVYASPERLVSGGLGADLTSSLQLVAVDEAHCISHWGHDFRPEYRQLAGLLDTLGAVPRMALTATATPTVRQDIVHQLGLRSPLELVGHPDRPNLVYRSLARRNPGEQVLEVIRRHRGEGGIVYALSRNETERMAERLRAAGIDAAAYHAGLPGGERARVQAAFVNEALDVVVATVAFGMGIDRSNVRFVVHLGCPRSIEHYQQESGRAGRDGLPAECVLLYAAGDFQHHRFLVSRDDPDGERGRQLEWQLAEVGRFAVAPVCRHRLLSEHFAAPYPAEGPATEDGCGACDVCLGETVELPPAEALVTAQKILSAVWRCRQRFGAAHIAKVLRGSKSEAIERCGHQHLSVFGLLANQGERELRVWIDQLVVQGLLQTWRNDRNLPLLALTEAGTALCKGQGEVRLTATPKSTTSTARRGRSRDAEGWDGIDRELFAELKELRREIANEEAVPPYVVFHDATLRALARELPRDEAAFRRIPGIGERKYQRYGERFLTALQAMLAGED